jgi:hypothetical protein
LVCHHGTTSETFFKKPVYALAWQVFLLDGKVRLWNISEDASIRVEARGVEENRSQRSNNVSSGNDEYVNQSIPLV